MSRFTRRYSKEAQLSFYLVRVLLINIIKSVRGSHRSLVSPKFEERERYRLHENDFVHGDLYPTTLLVPNSAPVDDKVLLIDFDLSFSFLLFISRFRR